jgi:hypothetical protein
VRGRRIDAGSDHMSGDGSTGRTSVRWGRTACDVLACAVGRPPVQYWARG